MKSDYKTSPKAGVGREPDVRRPPGYRMPEYMRAERKVPERIPPHRREESTSPRRNVQSKQYNRNMTNMKKARKVKTKNGFAISLLALVFVGTVFIVCFFSIKPRLTLAGDADVTSEVFFPYTDEGVSAKHMWFDIGKFVTFTSDVDTEKLGDYSVSYVLEYHGKSYTVSRHVTVIDSVPPEIVLNDIDENITVSSMDFYTEPGCSARDNYDGDITDRVEVTRTNDGENSLCILTYSVRDTFGNEARAERKVTVKDVVPPRITMFGESEITINTPYFDDPGCAVTDDFDGDITRFMEVTTDWEEGKEGDFTFTYTAMDAAGNSASVSRTVHVRDTAAPVITLLGSSSMKVAVGEKFVDPGATANDAFEGDVSEKITVSSLPDTSKVGTYYVKYYAEDSKGNGASATRTVVVYKGPTIINAPYISQNNGYINGCESVSTVMALRYSGINMTVDTFIDKYLDMGDKPTVGGTGPDPDVVYCGNPRAANGWGCNSPVIVKALGKFVDSGKYTVSHSYGKSLSELCSTYIDKGIPVIVWVTVDMKDGRNTANWTTPAGKQITYNRNLHCMLLVGYDDDNYYFNDPKRSGSGVSYVGYSKSAAENAYSLLGKQSIAIFAK